MFETTNFENAVTVDGTRNTRRVACAGDRLDSLAWAGVFLWGALVVLAESAGYTEALGILDGWGVFFVGVGTIVLAGTALRWWVPTYRRPGLEWGAIFGLFLLGVGLGEGATWIWPLVLAGIGIAILRTALRDRR